MLTKITILILHSLLLGAAAQPPALALAPKQAGCLKEMVDFSHCLPFVLDPQNHATDTVPSQCCDVFVFAFESGDANCFCNITRHPFIFGFPLNKQRIASLLSFCTGKNRAVSLDFCSSEKHVGDPTGKQKEFESGKAEATIIISCLVFILTHISSWIVNGKYTKGKEDRIEASDNMVGQDVIPAGNHAPVASESEESNEPQVQDNNSSCSGSVKHQNDSNTPKMSHQPQLDPNHQNNHQPPTAMPPLMSEHIACLQPLTGGHVGARLHVMPTSPSKFCDECGISYLRETSKFCSECGIKRLGIYDAQSELGFTSGSSFLELVSTFMNKKKVMIANITRLS